MTPVNHRKAVQAILEGQGVDDWSQVDQDNFVPSREQAIDFINYLNNQQVHKMRVNVDRLVDKALASPLGQNKALLYISNAFRNARNDG